MRAGISQVRVQVQVGPEERPGGSNKRGGEDRGLSKRDVKRLGLDQEGPGSDGWVWVRGGGKWAEPVWRRGLGRGGI